MKRFKILFCFIGLAVIILYVFGRKIGAIKTGPADWVDKQVEISLFPEEKTNDELTPVEFVRAVDGDTIIVNIDGEEKRVRLIGVDTPESVASQAYLEKTGKENTEEGKVASEFTKELLSSYSTVYLQKDKDNEDLYGRGLYYVWLEIPNDVNDIEEIRTKMLEGILLDNGYAVVAIYKPNNRYADEFNAIYTGTTSLYVND